MADLTEQRAASRKHEREIQARTTWLDAALIAESWGVCQNTVRDIPRDELPYMELGRGAQKRRRRYDPADVAAYEAWKKSGRQGNPPGARAA